MEYADFLELENPPSGQATSEYSDYPLWFGEHEELLEAAADFSVIDALLEEHDMEDLIEDFAERFPEYRALAACDAEAVQAHDAEFELDRYSEFLLVVDTGSPGDPVLLWAGEDDFETLFESFEEFWDSLDEWSPSAIARVTGFGPDDDDDDADLDDDDDDFDLDADDEEE